MIIIETTIPGPLIIEPKIHGDDRGFFLETWNSTSFKEAGLDVTFVQDNHSRSQKGVLRGLHFQNPNPQGKLVRVTSGSVWDVVVDVRRSSEYFGRWTAVTLTAANKRLFWVPPGFAHGFLTLEDNTDFLYKCTDYYSPSTEQSLLWNDQQVAIEWPLDGIIPLLSNKDCAGVSLGGIRSFA